MANTTEWFKGFLVLGFLLGLVTYFSTREVSISFWMFVIVVVITTAYAYFTRCENCDNCFSVREINNRIIDTNVIHIPFTKDVEVGRSEKYYHYVNGGTRQTHTDIHFEKRNFVKEVTRKKYEHTHKCEFCGKISKTYSTSESSEIFSA